MQELQRPVENALILHQSHPAPLAHHHREPVRMPEGFAAFALRGIHLGCRKGRRVGSRENGIKHPKIGVRLAAHHHLEQVGPG